MKIGFCMLLWTTSVTEQHRALLEDIKATGYDGVEIPIFGGAPDDYSRLGRMLDEIGLKRTSITAFISPGINALSEDAAMRREAADFVKNCIDCSAALGSPQLMGPLHQTLGVFSGAGPTEAEQSRARDFHHEIGDYAASNGNRIILETLNRFECYFVNTMDDLGAYLDSVAHPAITGMYDTFHANIEETDPVAAIGRNIRHIGHVHISENDRGVPGRGHVPWAASFAALKQAGYDQWLTIEAFGRSVPELAAATRAWRDFAESPEAVYREGFRTIREGWAAA